MDMALGFLFVVLGAMCGGSFGLPSKFVKKETPWEVLWGPFFFFVTILIPTVFAPSVVKDLGGVYAEAGTKTIVTVLIFGLLWGLGSMTLVRSSACRWPTRSTTGPRSSPARWCPWRSTTPPTS